MRKSHVYQFATFGLIGSLLAIPAVVGSFGCDLDDAQAPQSVEAADEPLPVDEPEGPAEEPVVYGGNPVASCGWPTAVSLEGSCTGTLIHPEVVVYAAHCGTKFKSIRFGDDGSGKNDGFSVSTKYCRKYPGYSENKKGVDFAYCRLSQPVDEFPVVPPLMGCETAALKPGAEVAVVGFGNTEKDSKNDIKHEVYTQLKSIKNNEAFIGGNGKDSCNGDSGGPVFIELADGSWRAFGITSYGGKCGTGGYYSMMHIGMPWFESDSGLDLTPCHDADGNWDPGPNCTGFPLAPADGGGSWPSCASGPLSGASSTCGAPLGGGDPDPEQPEQPEPEQPEPEQPEPDSCAGWCGDQAPDGCWCDKACKKYGDCCSDYKAQCG